MAPKSSINAKADKKALNETAILVRAIYQTREFEERFLKIGIKVSIISDIFKP